jgi:hypothetical protein
MAMRNWLWKFMPTLLGVALGPAAGFTVGGHTTYALVATWTAVALLFVFAWLMATYDDWHRS